jgi:hypothetical protein
MCVGVFALLPIENSEATGLLKADWNGFLRRSADRSDSTLTLSAGPRLFNTNPLVEWKLEVDAIVQVSDTKNLAVDRSALTLESTNTYLATSKELWSKHQLTFGRRVYDWSKFDDVWRFGTVSPRFIWDPTRPQTIGLTGAFYTYQSHHWRVLGYASPLSIPERGYPLRNEDGKLLSSNPFYNPFYDQAVIAKRNIPVRYTIDYPPTKELIFNPGAVLSVRHTTEEDGSGLWAQGLYGYLPVHQANLAVAPQYVLQQDVIDVRIHPEIQRHHLLSFEAGYSGSEYSVWVSQTAEKPTSRDVPSNWIATDSGRALISAVGGEVSLHPLWKLSASFIYVDEENPVYVEQPEFTVDIPGRFMFHRAAKAALAYQASDRMSFTLGFLDDLEKESQLMSFDILYHAKIIQTDSALTLNLGSDFFASATGKGYIGQYKGNDRFRGAVSYAF